MSDIFISIVIPFLNEEKRISKCIENVREYFTKRNLNFEFVFVNDGSTDNTVDLIKDLLKDFANYKIIHHKQNMGKGAAIRSGMLNSEGKWAIFMDADYSVPIEEFEKFERYMDDYQVIIGSRKTEGSNVEIRQHPVREFMGKVFTWLSNFILSTNYSDFTCGFKCFRGDVINKIFGRQIINRWSYDSEILYLVKKLNLKYIEVPVRWRNDPNTKVRLLKDTVDSFLDLIRIRFYDLSGRYDK